MDYIICFLYKHGLVAISLIILIEYACFPLSSEIVLPFSGVVAYMYKIDIRVLVILSIIAGVIGSSVCFVIGRMYGNRCLGWIEKRIPKTSNAIHKSEEFFNKYGNIAVLIGRLIPLCRTYISFVAGAFKQSFSSFVIYSMVGIAVWNTVLIYLGYLLGNNWRVVGIWYLKYKKWILICIAVMMLVFVLKYVKEKRKKI